MTIHCIRKGLTFLTIFHGLRSQKLSLNQEILPHLKIPYPYLSTIYSSQSALLFPLKFFFQNQIGRMQVLRYSRNIRTVALILISLKFWQQLRKPK